MPSINYGNIYFHGLDVNKNFTEAKKYYDLAANQDKDFSVKANAHYQLGNIYLYGLGVNKNFTEAKKYYGLAANQNENLSIKANAQNNINEINKKQKKAY